MPRRFLNSVSIKGYSFKEFDTMFKAQTRKMTTYSREKRKLRNKYEWVSLISLLSLTLILLFFGKFSVLQCITNRPHFSMVHNLIDHVYNDSRKCFETLQQKQEPRGTWFHLSFEHFLAPFIWSIRLQTMENVFCTNLDYLMKYGKNSEKRRQRHTDREDWIMA